MTSVATKPAVGLFDFASNVTEGKPRELFEDELLPLLTLYFRYPQHNDRLRPESNRCCPHATFDTTR